MTFPFDHKTDLLVGIPMNQNIEPARFLSVPQSEICQIIKNGISISPWPCPLTLTLPFDLENAKNVTPCFYLSQKTRYFKQNYQISKISLTYLICKSERWYEKEMS
jgi:hypothetical protein